MNTSEACKEIDAVLADLGRDETLAAMGRMLGSIIAREGCMICRENDWRDVQRRVRMILLRSPCRGDCGQSVAQGVS